MIIEEWMVGFDLEGIIIAKAVCSSCKKQEDCDYSALDPKQPTDVDAWQCENYAPKQATAD